jgi:16S rRNA (uracil1498-N3)-methyltransferase
VPKSPPTVLCPGPWRPGEVLRVTGAELAHARARRLVVGDPVRVLDAMGHVAGGVVSGLGRGFMEVEIERRSDVPAAGPAVVLLAPALRLPRLSWLVEKATELNVSEIRITGSSRSQGSRARGVDTHRLERVAMSAMKQCGRTDWPRCTGIVAWEDALRTPGEHRWLLDPSGEPFPASLVPSASVIWIGPEGGFSPAEISAAAREGWRFVGLPGATLRAETAAVAALALLAAAFDRASPRGGK